MNNRLWYFMRGNPGKYPRLHFAIKAALYGRGNELREFY